MPNFSKGKLDFEARRIGEHLGAGDVCEEYACHPPPSGTVRRSNPELDVKPVLLTDYLQAAEGARIAEGTGSPDFQSANTEAFAALGLRALGISLIGIPPGWRAVRQCYGTQIVVVCRYGVWRIDVTAKEAVTLGGQAFPQGDVVASYRVLAPEKWRFERRFEFDARCCKEQPEHPPATETTDWLPLDLNWDPWGPEWKWKGLDRYRLTPELKYEYERGKDADPWRPRIGLKYEW